jgi:hypothetical protein
LWLSSSLCWGGGNQWPSSRERILRAWIHNNIIMYIYAYSSTSTLTRICNCSCTCWPDLSTSIHTQATRIAHYHWALHSSWVPVNGVYLVLDLTIYCAKSPFSGPNT